MLKPQYNDPRYNDILDITGIKSVFQQKVLIIQKQSKDIQNNKASLAKYRSNKRPVLYPG